MPDRIGKPVKSLPASATVQARQFWATVADTAKQAPGQWIPVTVHANRARQMASSIRHHKKRGTPAALRDPGFTAEARAGRLYICWSADHA